MKTTAAWIAAAAASLAPPLADAQPRGTMDAGHLQIALERLGTTARVLYVAAHPDDENTRLLAYLANGRHLDVAYLSLTRGGGGQNLIGSEQAEMLALIRTQELLAARRLDGAAQRFTRARDFGYSKTPEETLAKWGEEAVLADVVWVLRTFRPDVIVTRFTEDGATHGHHTASARLARAAFEAAADPARFPEQLSAGVEPWPAHRLVLNVPHWRSDGPVDADLTLDVGGYDPRLGLSYGELAAKSRTMHKSQGFGSSGQRGPVVEHFRHLTGAKMEDDLLDGVPLGWARYPGGDAVEAALERARATFDPSRPERVVPPLLDALEALRALARAHPVPRVTDRVDDVQALIAAALGLVVEVRADRAEIAPGAAVDLEAEVLLRRPARVRLDRVRWPGSEAAVGGVVEPHRPIRLEHVAAVPKDAAPSVPYWLGEPIDSALYPISDPLLVGAPQSPPALQARFTFDVEGHRVQLDRPVRHAWTDRVHGERRRRVLVVPAAMVTPVHDTVLFPGGAARAVAITVRAGRADVEAEVGLDLPVGWRSEPAAHTVRLDAAGDARTVRFEVRPPKPDAAPVRAAAWAKVGGRTSRLRYDRIDHPHLPVQGVLRPARIRLAPVDFTPPEGLVGYVPGSGDTVAENLRQVGVEVEEVPEDALRAGELAPYRAIVLGVRAFNTKEELLRAAHPALMRWVEAGGTLVVQYNTSNRWRRLDTPVGPYPLEIDRGRVTDETARVTALDPEHRLLSHPHRIGPEDFVGWVQERGLYFAETWDDRYTPIFELADPGEAPERGSVLVAEHGEGAFVYTGLSFFRQLPAGVPGAYRLLANLIAYGGPR